jgi:hypothetical protein
MEIMKKIAFFVALASASLVHPWVKVTNATDEKITAILDLEGGPDNDKSIDPGDSKKMYTGAGKTEFYNVRGVRVHTKNKARTGKIGFNKKKTDCKGFSTCNIIKKQMQAQQPSAPGAGGGSTSQTGTTSSSCAVNPDLKPYCMQSFATNNGAASDDKYSGWGIGCKTPKTGVPGLSKNFHVTVIKPKPGHVTVKEDGKCKDIDPITDDKQDKLLVLLKP